MKTDHLRTIETANRLGEGVQWDCKRQTIHWTDILAARLYRYHWPSHTLDFVDLPERLGAFAMTEDDGIILAAFASGFARYEPGSGACRWLSRPERDFRGTRFNDGRVDRQGRFWCGTMVEAAPARDADGNPVKGSLYCLERGQAVKKLGDIGIANSLCWSKTGKTAYFADSREQTIWAFDFDAPTATLDNRRVFATTQGDAVPDGSCIDSEDCLWNAEYHGGRITRYRPDGAIDTQLELPVTQPTCVAFGGPNLDCLIVTSARDGLGPDTAEEQAGHVFIYQTDVKGLEENRVTLSSLAAGTSTNHLI